MALRDVLTRRPMIIRTEESWNRAHDALLASIGQTVKVIGLDCEFLTQEKLIFEGQCSWASDRSWALARDGQVGLLQLASCGGVVVIIQLYHMQEVPPSLEKLLADPQLYKVGVNIEEDCRRLSRDYGLVVDSWVDLRYLCSSSNEFHRFQTGMKLGLKAIANALFGPVGFWPSDERVSWSNWGALHLSAKQVAYASADAAVATLIFQKLAHEHLRKFDDYALTDQDVATYLAPYVHRCFVITPAAASNNTGGYQLFHAPDMNMADSRLDLNLLFDQTARFDAGLNFYDQHGKLRCRLRRDVLRSLTLRSEHSATSVHLARHCGDDIIEVELRCLKDKH